VCEEQGWDKEQGGGMDQKGVLKKKLLSQQPIKAF